MVRTNLFQKLALPVHQILLMRVPIFREIEQSGAACNKRLIDAQLAGAFVAALLEGRRPALDRVAYATEFMADGLW